MLGYLPGLLHAWYIIAKYPDGEGYEAIAPDAEAGSGDGGRVTYYYVTREEERVGAGRGGVSGREGGYGGVGQGGVPVGGRREGGQGVGEGLSRGAVPPSYDDAVKGDHKVQT